MTEDKELIDYFKKEKLSSQIVSIGVKLVLSILVIWYNGLTSDVFNILLVGCIIYFLCSLFQFSLHLTNNYIVAVMVFVLLIAGAFVVLKKISDSIESKALDNFSIIIVIIAANIFLFMDIYRVIKYIRLRNKSYNS